MFQRLNNPVKAEDKDFLYGKLPGQHTGTRISPPYTVDPLKPFQRAIIRAFNYYVEKPGNGCELSIHSLLEAASKRTGLDDMGAPSYREPLEIMVKSVEKEDRLHPFGKLCFRQLIINLIVNRLLIEEECKKKPHLLNKHVPAPVIIMGLPRTGTSFLLNLLASDRRFRYLTSWEAMHPVLPKGKEKRRMRRLMAAIELGTQNYLAPAIRTIHRYYLDGPEECTRLLFNHFSSQALDLVFDMPDYREWLKSHDYLEAYRYHKRQLQLLGGRNNGGSWLLKSPYHLPALDALLKVYPDARIIHLYRDPLKSVPSFCSLTTSYRGICNRTLDGNKTGRETVDFLQNGVERFLHAREKMDGSNIIDIDYKELTRDPLSVIEEIYHFFKLSLSDNARSSMVNQSHLSHGNPPKRHRYSLEQFGLNEKAILQRFSPYMDRFKL